MPEYQRFTTASGMDVEFEVETAGGGGSLDDALDVMAALAGAVTAKVQNLDEGTAPEEVELSFGLSPTSVGSLAVTSGQSTAHLRVTLRFAGDGGGFGQVPGES